jgi:predicted transcriptional regulator of viral defense system
MIDVRVVELAARQYNRFSREQVLGLGVSPRAIRHRLMTGRWVAVREGVYAIAPAMHDERAEWMAATLTVEGSWLSHASAGAAWGWWTRQRDFEIVTRRGSGGPQRVDGILVHRSLVLDGDTTKLDGIPITAVERTLLDLAAHVGLRALARAVREALRLQTTTPAAIADALATRHRGRRGSRRLALVLAAYTGVPVERCRSGTEVEALIVLRDAGRAAPGVNVKIAGEEADLSWARERLIVEIDGGPFHLDVGEDARKQAIWERAGWTVRRLPSHEVFECPERLLTLVPTRERRASDPTGSSHRRSALRR